MCCSFFLVGSKVLHSSGVTPRMLRTRGTDVLSGDEWYTSINAAQVSLSNLKVFKVTSRGTLKLLWYFKPGVVESSSLCELVLNSLHSKWKCKCASNDPTGVRISDWWIVFLPKNSSDCPSGWAAAASSCWMFPESIGIENSWVKHWEKIKIYVSLRFSHCKGLWVVQSNKKDN